MIYFIKKRAKVLIFFDICKFLCNFAQIFDENDYGLRNIASS